MTTNNIAPHVDMEQRFAQEVRALPTDLTSVTLHGNPMHIAITTALLSQHAPHINISDTGTPITLMSMEAFGSAFLGTFLEERNPPQQPLLLHTIPESELLAFATRHNIPLVEEERDDVRKMLDRIAVRQPQTYFSLCRSAQRLLDVTENLRTPEHKD